MTAILALALVMGAPVLFLVGLLKSPSMSIHVLKMALKSLSNLLGAFIRMSNGT